MLTNKRCALNARTFMSGSLPRDAEAAAKRKDKKYKPYADKFAYFLSKEFLVKRMFENLNAEGKPEYVGFKKACDDLFPIFKERFFPNEDVDNLLECLYDEYMMNLDVEKAAFFFWWLGVCKEETK